MSIHATAAAMLAAIQEATTRRPALDEKVWRPRREWESFWDLKQAQAGRMVRESVKAGLMEKARDYRDGRMVDVYRWVGKAKKK